MISTLTDVLMRCKDLTPNEIVPNPHHVMGGCYMELGGHPRRTRLRPGEVREDPKPKTSDGLRLIYTHRIFYYLLPNSFIQVKITDVNLLLINLENNRNVRAIELLSKLN